MILGYSRPQLTIKQLLETTAAGATSRLYPCVIGPRYLLNRYGKETVPGEEFTSDGQVLSWKYFNNSGVATALPGTHTIDTASVKVYGAGLEASLATYAFDGSTKFNIPNLSNPNIIKISAGNVVGEDPY